METNRATPDWFTVFRMAENDGWLYDELTEGRLRQGWGAPGLGLRTADGGQLEKAQWEATYRENVGDYWGDPSPQRFAILSRMLELDDGDVVVVPKMPEKDQFTIACVSAPYTFDDGDPDDGDPEDFRHIVPVRPDSVRTFGNRADRDAFLVSALFARANHRSAVSFCESSQHVEAVHRLMNRQCSQTSRSYEDLYHAAINDAFKAAATALRRQVEGWNGHRFEEAVRQAFRDQGYEVKPHQPFDGQGGDADILLSPPASPLGLFLPAEIAVQVKWKQGVDESDEESIRQIVKWAKSIGSDAVKYVISSASRFTDEAYERAAANNVVLIGGLQTMCFLLGTTDRYRDDWD